MRRLSDQDSVRGCGCLESCRGVDDVPGDHALPFSRTSVECDKRLPRVDADADGKPELRLPVELIDRGADRKSGAHRALGIVLVGNGRTEDGHDRVSDELLDRAAVTFDLASQPSVVRREQGADVLGVELLRSAGEADEVRQTARSRPFSPPAAEAPPSAAPHTRRRTSVPPGSSRRTRSKCSSAQA